MQDKGPSGGSTRVSPRPVIYPDDQVLVFVVRKDGEPGILLNDCTKGQASMLLRMMSDRLAEEAG